MRNPLVVATFVLAMPALGTAAPCLPNSLAGYITLGSGGCEIGGASFFDFSAAPSFFGGTAIDPGTVIVLPSNTSTGSRLEFVFSTSVAAGEVAGAAIGYSGTGVAFTGAGLSMSGALAGGDGAVSVVEDVCVGDVFVSDPSNCLMPPPVSLIVAADSLGPIGPDSRAFGPASFFDVFVDVTIDGGLAGSASLDGRVTNDFTTAAAPEPVPEPSALALVGSGLLGLWGRRRKRDS